MKNVRIPPNLTFSQTLLYLCAKAHLIHGLDYEAENKKIMELLFTEEANNNNIGAKEEYVKLDKFLKSNHNLINIIILILTDKNNKKIKLFKKKRKKVYTKVYTKKRKADELLLHLGLGDNPNLVEIVNEFIEMREAKKRLLTPTAIRRIASKLRGIPIEEVISSLSRSIENDWTGVYVSPAKDSTPKQKPIVEIEISMYSSVNEINKKIQQLEKDGYEPIFFLDSVRIAEQYTREVFEKHFEGMKT